MSSPTRRAFIGGTLGAAGLAAAGGAGFYAARADEPAADSRSTTVPFYGIHQAGIATPAQARVAFAAFDMEHPGRAALQSLLWKWTDAAALMTQGRPIGAVAPSENRSPVDTGEALDLGPARLTITVGFGPSLFDKRFGLSNRRPAALAPLPPFPHDDLDPARSNGDLGVQACSDDPQVAFHVIRDFAKLAHGTATMRWTQLGFGRTSSTSTTQPTPRNLMGFKDGTRNIKSESTDEMDRFVWVGAETDQRWMVGGSYLVARRIRMHIEDWDAEKLREQERVFGRRKVSGAPLTGTSEFDPPNLRATKDGKPVIDVAAHIRLAAPSSNQGERILRRGYSFTDGIDPRTGELDAGLFFLAYQKDPRSQFVTIAQRLADHDLLNEYIKHTASAVFAVPPGVRGPGDYFGKALLD